MFLMQSNANRVIDILTKYTHNLEVVSNTDTSYYSSVTVKYINEGKEQLFEVMVTPII